jgi:hypothetical protein
MSELDQTHRSSSAAAAVDNTRVFNYDLTAAPRGAKVQLLNIGGVAIYGTIQNLEIAKQMGVIAWAHVPARDRDKEIELGYLMANKEHKDPAREKRANSELMRAYAAMKYAAHWRITHGLLLQLAIILAFASFVGFLFTKGSAWVSVLLGFAMTGFFGLAFIHGSKYDQWKEEERDEEDNYERLMTRVI